MFPGAKIIWRCRLGKFKFTFLKRFQHVQVVARREPKYPTIIETSKEGAARHKRQVFYDSIRNMPTVEQKLYEITSKRNVCERTFMISGLIPAYCGVPFQHYITRTHLIHGLPQSYENLNVDEEYEAVKENFATVVQNSYLNLWRESKLNSTSEYAVEDNCGSKLVNSFMSLICRSFAEKKTHLLDAAFDPESSLKAYWFHGDFIPWKERIGLKYSNLCFQFSETPAYTVRINKPLAPVVPLNDPLCATAEVVQYNYSPVNFGIPYKHDHASSIPGFWPGDACDFPLLQVHTSDRLFKLTSKLDHYDLKTIEDGYGIMCSFGWLNALATYQGFTVYHDLTYPITGQMILTDGQDWTFFVYQLNTITFHSDLDKKDRRNLCWTSGKLRLFDETENGRPKELNSEVLKILLKFMLNTPQAPEGLNLKPYLGEDTRTDEEIVATRRESRNLYRNFVPLNSYGFELPMWQRVYKRHPDAPPCPTIKLE